MTATAGYAPPRASFGVGLASRAQGVKTVWRGSTVPCCGLLRGTEPPCGRVQESFASHMRTGKMDKFQLHIT
ncbi:UNVERIFIED_CONTAM: hypothetical protein Slati_1682300 [Sesamum latifolium]|uniref:Uncharacterized protein n=1 Tax=Sesamum latifolium TaxID=2727402 RepID=A0AAW2WX91_9LAMI